MLVCVGHMMGCKLSPYIWSIWRGALSIGGLFANEVLGTYFWGEGGLLLEIYCNYRVLFRRLAGTFCSLVSIYMCGRYLYY